jgi:putative chitinase
MDSQQLKAIMPGCDADLWLPHLNKVMADRQIDSSIRIATFLAHVAVESAEMRLLAENMNYSAGRLMAVWPTRFPSAEVAAPYAHNPDKLGSFVYANRLGNGAPSTGDGFKFRGRGLLQATGRDHYHEASLALNVDLTAQPELLEQPSWASEEAAWWWQKQGLNAIADTGDMKQSTLKINGGLNGYSDRVAYWRRGLEALGTDTSNAAADSEKAKVQKALNARGAQPQLKEDGIWGPMSEAAADRFRTEAGLPQADGVDATLLQALGITE